VFNSENIRVFPLSGIYTIADVALATLRDRISVIFITVGLDIEQKQRDCASRIVTRGNSTG
jgi:hypothetical protein